jgi:hypothetical protein
MALLAPQRPTIDGEQITFGAASGGGDTFAPNPRGVLYVDNGDASPKTVTIANPGTDQYGVAKPDIPVTCPNGQITAISLPGQGFPTDLADPADDLVHISYSATTSVTVAYVVN